jgi:hypothetical protein
MPTAGERGDAGLVGCPTLELFHGGRPAVRYSVLPEGHEGPPFVELLLALVRLAGSSAAATQAEGLLLDQATAQSLAVLDQPASLLVFVTTACPLCPAAVRTAIGLALASPCITTTIVDAQQFPEIAQRFSVRATPTTILDGGLTLTGMTRPQDIAAHVLARGTPGFEDRIFRSLVESGRLSDAASRLLAQGGPGTLVRAWRQSTTSSRIGLLLVTDDVLGQARAALDGAVPDLLSLLGSDDAAMAGDTADLLGRIGHPSAAPALQALRDHPNPDVAEIAADACEQLRAAEGGAGDGVP